MSEWKDITLFEVIDLIGGGTPKTSNSQYWGGDIPWLSVVDFNHGFKHVETTEKAITKEGLNNSSTKLLKPGDIIISARGTVGAMAVLKREMAFNQSCYGIRAKDQVADNDFIYYLTKDSINKFQQYAYGGVFDTITRDTFKSIEISLPPLPEQKAIASVLSSLDDKIDLLHRQNKTLEAMAETLFRQWFVEEAGEEWEYDELSKYVSTIDNRGKTPPNTDVPSPYPIIEVNALTGDDRLVDYSVIRKYVDEDTFKSFFRKYPEKYDVFLSTVGSLGAISMFLQETGVIAQNVIGLRANERLSSFYLYQVLKYKTKEIIQLDIGGVQPSIKVPHLLSLIIPIPTLDMQRLFDNQMELYVKKIEQNQIQIQTLKIMRDILLPKLMSGEVKVDL